MTVFVVISRHANAELKRSIEAAYPASSHPYGDKGWFISSKQTSREVSEKIGVKRGGITGVVIVATTGSYYGVAASEVWDWLRSAVENDDG